MQMDGFAPAGGAALQSRGWKKPVVDCLLQYPQMLTTIPACEARLKLHRKGSASGQ